MSIKLGIAPINWSNDDDPNLGKDISFQRCIKEMAQAGYSGTELGSKFPRDIKVLQPALAEQGLQLASAWFSTYFTEEGRGETTLSHFLEQVSFLRAMGARFINVCECGHAISGSQLPVFGPLKPKFSESQWRQLIQGLHTIGRIAQDFNLQIVYHYHAGTGVFNKDEIDFLMQHTSPELVSLLLDTGHAACADIDPMHLIESHGSRIRYVHLKDIRLNSFNKVITQNLSFMDGVRAGLFTVPGDGCLDFSPILAALKSASYNGWMIVEAEQDPVIANPLDYAQKAMAYLSKFTTP
jgi:inosose dehydratase